MSSEVKVYTVITGASDGLGKALALECARLHYNLILTALPGKELDNLSAFIKSNFDVDVITLSFDLTAEENCFQFCHSLIESGVQVNMLINNVGLGSTVQFEKGEIDLFLKQINLNVNATVILTKLLLPLLLNHKKSYILNVSSLSVFFFLYAKSVYGASKSFIYYFSKSLRKELKTKGVNVTVLMPGGINSNVEKYLTNKDSGFFLQLSFMNPEDVATLSIKALLKGKEEVIPGITNKIFKILNYLLPGFFKNMLMLNNIKRIEKENN